MDPTMRDYINAADSLRDFGEDYDIVADALEVDRAVKAEVLRAIQRCHDFTRFFATLIDAEQAAEPGGADVADSFERGS